MEALEGTIEQIFFHNDSNNYTVAKLKVKNGRAVTIVGNLPPLYTGEEVNLTGEWVKHKDYGEQFQVQECHSKVPKTLLGIERFLAGGLIKGIGPVTAQKIVKKFGLETLDVINHSPERLVEIPGISMAKAERIGNNLRDHAEVQKIMVFLQGVGISPAYALKIFRCYKHQAIQVVTENPYRLADEVFGIGFKIADQIARKVGIEPDSPYRIRAGIRFLLNEFSNEGHVFAPEQKFIAMAGQELGVNVLQLAAELEELILSKEVFRETVNNEKILYLASFYYSEVGAGAKIGSLLNAPLRKLEGDTEAWLGKFSEQQQLSLAEKQKEAVLTALANGMMVITGGPGTGKTTIVKAILYLFKTAGFQVMLAAPTGRAAKRLSETTKEEAKTIHRLLGYGGAETGNGSRFHHNEQEPLDTDVLIVDEFSMVDLILFYNLLKALKPGTRLIVVGDVDQLPSVGPGSVLKDIIGSERVPTVRLNVIFRQAEESLIISNAHKINRGEFPYLTTKGDFFFIQDEDPEHIVSLLPELVSKRIPQFLHCDPVEDIQVLAPMRRTITGVDNLNLVLQEALNPGGPAKAEIKTNYATLRVGDKVMQLRNEYQKMVFNGDIGRVCEIDPEERTVTVKYSEVGGDRLVLYETEDLDQLVISYAISVHKSQGNEYPVVIIPVTTQHFLMLQRNLIYTAVTRAKKMVVLVGTKKAIAIAVRNNKIEERYSLLDRRIREAVSS